MNTFFFSLSLSHTHTHTEHQVNIPTLLSTNWPTQNMYLCINIHCQNMYLCINIHCQNMYLCINIHCHKCVKIAWVQHPLLRQLCKFLFFPANFSWPSLHLGITPSVGHKNAVPVPQFEPQGRRFIHFMYHYTRAHSLANQIVHKWYRRHNLPTSSLQIL